MKDYQESLLEELFLPCAHNTTTYTRAISQPGAVEQLLVPFASSWDACQTAVLKDQLSYGVRVVDFRLASVSTGQMFTVHGLHCMPFTTALEDVAKFIRDPICERTETLVVRLNEGYTSVGGQKWNVDWKEAARLVYAFLPVATIDSNVARKRVKDLAGTVVLDIPENAVDYFKPDIYRAITLKSWHDKEFSTNTNDPELMHENLSRWIDLREEEILKSVDVGVPNETHLYFLSTPCTPKAEDIVASYNPIKRIWLKYTSLAAYAIVAWPLVSKMLQERKDSGKLPPVVVEIDMVSKVHCDEVIALNR